jgi:putative RNA 2'-phosphotransferase
MTDDVVRISKFLSLVLRHKPHSIGLALDEHGWANVDDLISKANQAGIALTPELLDLVVEKNNKKRFSFSADRLRIRANQGHSIPVDLELEPQHPPEYLFHGTVRRNLASIKEKGLLHGRRNHVHLSIDEETAFQVGRRHGSPLVLKIKAKAMDAAGCQFWLSVNEVWLAEQVPVEFIEFPEESQKFGANS